MKRDKRIPDSTKQECPYSKTVVPAYLRRKQATVYLSITAKTLSNWQSRRVVAYSKVGKCVLFKRQDLDDAMARHRRRAIGEEL